MVFFISNILIQNNKGLIRKLFLKLKCLTFSKSYIRMTNILIIILEMIISIFIFESVKLVKISILLKLNRYLTSTTMMMKMKKRTVTICWAFIGDDHCFKHFICMATFKPRTHQMRMGPLFTEGSAMWSDSFRIIWELDGRAGIQTQVCLTKVIRSSWIDTASFSCRFQQVGKSWKFFTSLEHLTKVDLHLNMPNLVLCICSFNIYLLTYGLCTR